VIRYLKNLISNKIIQILFAKQKKEKKSMLFQRKKKYSISDKNPWLNPKDNFGKLEKGKV
tara:strand:+ start:448 stop:627 length:180 start_codon:yes stop_codon:yes gene_type:complete